jgi:hypothetical protein
MLATIPLKNPRKCLLLGFMAMNTAFQSLAHPLNNKADIIDFCVDIGQFPTTDGLFGPPHLAYFGRLSLSPAFVKP